MLKKYKYHIWLHFIIFIFGLTGILGKLISVDSYLLVWYRLLIALLVILIYFFFSKTVLKISRNLLTKTLLTGVIIAAHWVTFFSAIKVSNVSVALVCFSSSALFTSIIEPIYYKRKLKVYEFLLGIFIGVSLYFIFRFEFKYVLGMILGVVSAILSSWFTVINSVLARETSSKLISFYELLGAFVAISVYLFLTKGIEIQRFYIPVSDIKWLLILGGLCTAFAFMVSVEVVKKISPYTVSLSINLEPVYSIFLAFLIWPETETMSNNFYIGALIITLLIFLNAVLKGKKFSMQKL